MDDITRTGHNVEIAKQHLKVTARKFKHGKQWVIQMYTKHTTKLVPQWLKDNMVNVVDWLSQSPDFNHRKFAGRAEKGGASKVVYKCDSVPPVLSG